MNDDIVLEPGDKTSEEIDASQNQDAESQAAAEPKAPEQIFDVTPDLNISPTNVDSIGSVADSIGTIPSEGIVDPTAKLVVPTPQVTIPQKVQIPVISKPQTSTIIPPVQPIYSSIPEAEKTVPGISAIRTYESDIAGLITKKGTSTADMMMAENKKETGQKDQITSKEHIHTGKKSLMAVISLVLILVGVAGAYYLYSISPLAPSTTVTPQPASVASLIPSDSQKILAVDGLNANTVLSKIQAEVSSPGTAGTIEEIIPYTTENGVKTRLAINDVIKLMDIPVPDMLARSLTASWMLGIYTDSQNKNSAFVVVTNNFFQNAFAGMLSWESVMPDDLKRYIYPASATGIANVPSQTTTTATTYSDPLLDLNSILPLSGSTTNATSTFASSSTLISSTTQKIASSSNSSGKKQATTTETDTPVIPYFTLRGQFVDKIVKNKDVREFITINGDTLFLYSFIDNTMLVIAGNEATLAEIITRRYRP